MADKLEASAGSIDLELELDERVEELEASRTASKRENQSSAPLTPKALNRPTSLGHSLSSVSSVESSLAKNSKSARSVSFGHGAGTRTRRARSATKGRENEASSDDGYSSDDFDEDDFEDAGHAASAQLGASAGSRHTSASSMYSQEFEDEGASVARERAPAPKSVDELLAQLRSNRQLPQQLWELREHVHAALDPARVAELAQSGEADGPRQLLTERRELETAIEQLEVGVARARSAPRGGRPRRDGDGTSLPLSRLRRWIWSLSSVRNGKSDAAGTSTRA